MYKGVMVAAILLKSGVLVPIGDIPDIWPDNPAFFDIRCPAGYRI
jgi:hypothetical protein